MLTRSNSFLVQPRAVIRPARASFQVQSAKKGDHLSNEVYRASTTAFLVGFAAAQGLVLAPGAAWAEQAAAQSSPAALTSTAIPGTSSEASPQPQLCNAPCVSITDALTSGQVATPAFSKTTDTSSDAAPAQDYVAGSQANLSEEQKIEMAASTAPQPSIDSLAEAGSDNVVKKGFAASIVKFSAPQPVVDIIAEAASSGDEKKSPGSAGSADGKKASALQPAVDNLAEAASSGDEKKGPGSAGSADGKKASAPQPAVDNLAEAASSGDAKKGPGSADGKKASAPQPAVDNLAEAASSEDEKKGPGSADGKKTSAPQRAVDNIVEAAFSGDEKKGPGSAGSADGKKASAPQPAVDNLAEAASSEDEKKSPGSPDGKKASAPQRAVDNIAETAFSGDEKKGPGSPDGKKASAPQPVVDNIAEAASIGDENKGPGSAGSADGKKASVPQPAVDNIAEAASSGNEKKGPGSADSNKVASPPPLASSVVESVRPAANAEKLQPAGSEASVPTLTPSSPSTGPATAAEASASSLSPSPEGAVAKSSLDYVTAAERVVSEIEREVWELESLLEDDPDALDVMQSIEDEVLLLESRLHKVGPSEPLEVAQEVEMELEVVEAETALLSVDKDPPKGSQSSLSVAAKGIQAQLSAIMAILSGL